MKKKPTFTVRAGSDGYSIWRRDEPFMCAFPNKGGAESLASVLEGVLTLAGDGTRMVALDRAFADQRIVWAVIKALGVDPMALVQ